MSVLLKAAVVLLPLAYLLVAIDYGALFFAGRSLRPGSATLGLRLALTLHAAYLIGLTLESRQLPAATLSQALSFVAFSIVTVYAFVEWHSKESSTGFWMVSLGFAFSLLSSLMFGPEPTERVLFANPIFAIHVSLALMGYAAFAVAASYGFLFLRLYRELKAGRFSLFFGKLPPLEVLEKMMSGALLFGFVALTGAVVIGLGWAQDVDPNAKITDPKIITTLGTWLLYAAALLLRRLRRWQGREMAIASLAGLATILFSFFAVNLWFSDFHTFL